MDKDKVNTEVKLSLLWNYGLSQLLKKNPPGNCSFTLHQVEIPMCVCVCVYTHTHIHTYIHTYIYASQLYNSRLQLNTSNSLELPW